jgi:hypothetical protein
MIQNRTLKAALQSQVLANKKIQKSFDQEVEKKFQIYKTEMLRELDSHPITKDLQNNVDSGLVARGTLFGFLGFENGEDPVRELRDLLETFCIIKFSKQNTLKGIRTYTAKIPTRDEIYNATPLRWAPGRSWVKAIEFGISGMGNYIEKKTNKSRSGEGIQSKTSNLGGKFRNAPYISSILNKFIKKIQSQGIRIK